MYKSCYILPILVTIILGCAAIMHGTTQDITVKSKPEGATVRVKAMEKGSLLEIAVGEVKTPGLLTLKRKIKGCKLIFELEGYEPVEVAITPVTSGAVFGNILIGGIPGFIVDFATGAAYNLTPAQVEVEMKRAGISIDQLNDPEQLYVFITLLN